MVSLGGFDTHSGQKEIHQGLLSNISDAINNSYTDLEDTGHDKNVLGMTFSEFERRVAENGSGEQIMDRQHLHSFLAQN